MFEYCESLEESPVLPATKLVEGCYNSMFSDCTSLGRVTCLATSGINSGANTSGWLSNVAERGTFIKASDASLWTSGDSGIPSDWAVENY